MCQCPTCEATDRRASDGFAAWPRGNPTGRNAATEYTQHVNFSKRWGVRKETDERGREKTVDRIPEFYLGELSVPDPASFYGTPKGSTAAEVRRVLRQSFGLEPMPEPIAKPERPVLSIVPKPATKPELADVAEFVRQRMAA